MQVMNDADAIALNFLRHQYLADDGEVLTTSAKQLQYDAYALGSQRAGFGFDDARALLAKVMQNHVTALPLAIRAEIEAVTGVAA